MPLYIRSGFFLQVCDRRTDCKFNEDEKYCVSLVSTDTIWLKENGRPLIPSTGLVAYQFKGVWKTICTRSWPEKVNNMICQYMGRKTGVSKRLIRPFSYPGKIKVFKILHKLF